MCTLQLYMYVHLYTCIPIHSISNIDTGHWFSASYAGIYWGYARIVGVSPEKQ